MTSKSEPDNKIPTIYSCSLCGKNLSSSTSLSSHLKTHSGTKTFCCEYCGAMYSTKQNLMAHLLRIHDISSDQIKACDICGKKFFRKSAFDNHKLIHSGQKPYNCHICNKYFRQKITRDLHIATHTGDYKHICSNCDRKFLSSYKYKLHQKKYKGQCPKRKIITDDYSSKEKNDLSCVSLYSNRIDSLNEANYHCKQCEQNFSSENFLKLHIVTHSNCSTEAENFSCSECNKNFKSSQGLEFHKKAHRGVYNFMCEVCGKLFLRNTHFVSHVKLHSNLRPYSCIICLQAFKSNKNLKEHTKSKHAAK